MTRSARAVEKLLDFGARGGRGLCSKTRAGEGAGGIGEAGGLFEWIAGGTRCGEGTGECVARGGRVDDVDGVAGDVRAGVVVCVAAAAAELEDDSSGTAGVQRRRDGGGWRCSWLVEQGGGFGFVGGEDVDGEEFVGKLSGGWSGIEDGRDAVAACEVDSVDGGFEGDFELEHAAAGLSDELFGVVDVAGRQMEVCAADDGDGVFASVGDGDQRDAGGATGSSLHVVTVDAAV